jgi:type IV pilus assembly protein PilA
MIKIIKSKKGFTMVELLIVIAILGIIMAIAFLTVTGVLNSSRQKVDYRNAELIERAIESYIFITEDAKLEYITYNADTIKNGDDSEKLILILQNKIICQKNGEELEPFLVPKDGNTPSVEYFTTQWENHKGYRIEIYPENMTCDVFPVEDILDAVININ